MKRENILEKSKITLTVLAETKDLILATKTSRQVDLAFFEGLAIYLSNGYLRASEPPRLTRVKPDVLV
ncbi:hypothetical protein GWO09_05560 [candidate division KSB1 bacterium]|nr:hypothetical protein [candidate division KSB1 bacterium]